MKKFKKDLSCFTDLPSMLRDVFKRLYFENCGVVRAQIPPKNKVKKYKINLKSSSLDDQSTHQMNLQSIDSQLVEYFIHGGEIIEI